ncbi:PRC-barrel domain-containing protein [Natrarchaeobaculum sulfurireducens]|uniref:Protein implicated in RNA metabolism, contains PRC-barrel domain n=1 Tax=Natrarchaeobaculum sulfurireducens TaxID=2044521 RepID=A0A346PGF3_9EURY|nr:PRC-barrel domain-containing protein [Natrarchaeobaculum sulfurireducens]AXR78598.1 Protein implicated in RNA metabolism, contains PRC-barrel domain [Natrarchaeobaculum sulfurireducens]
MSTVLASTLSEAPVMCTDGTELGTVRNLTMTVETGELEWVLVTPLHDDVSTEFDRADDGTIRIPATRVVGLDDYLMIDGRNSTA